MVTGSDTDFILYYTQNHYPMHAHKTYDPVSPIPLPNLVLSSSHKEVTTPLHTTDFNHTFNRNEVTGVDIVPGKVWHYHKTKYNRSENVDHLQR